MPLLRIIRYVFALLVGFVALDELLTPLNLALRNDDALADGLWVYDVALGLALVALAVWVWPKKPKGNRLDQGSNQRADSSR